MVIILNDAFGSDTSFAESEVRKPNLRPFCEVIQRRNGEVIFVGIASQKSNVTAHMNSHHKKTTFLSITSKTQIPIQKM